ncbi:MAG: caspase family protein [Pseudomonadota bacterium]
MRRSVSLFRTAFSSVRLCAVLCLLLAAAPAVADTRRALVIGINAYDKIPTLEKAVNDATAVGAQLRAAGFVTEVLLDAGGTEVVASLERLTASVEPGDEVVFYFAGHGVEIEGQNYLLPADVELPVGGGELAIRRQSLPVAEVTDALERQGARVSLLILDACRDNPFARQGTRSVGTRRGLARMVAPEGTFIMYSAGEGQSALDSLGPDDANPNSVFTRALLPKLSTPGMRLRDMAVDVRSEVIQLARGVGHNQFPAVYDQLDGRFEVTPAAVMADAGGALALLGTDASGDGPEDASTSQVAPAETPAAAPLSMLTQVAPAPVQEGNAAPEPGGDEQGETDVAVLADTQTVPPFQAGAAPERSGNEQRETDMGVLTEAQRRPAPGPDGAPATLELSQASRSEPAEARTVAPAPVKPSAHVARVDPPRAGNPVSAPGGEAAAGGNPSGAALQSHRAGETVIGGSQAERDAAGRAMDDATRVGAAASTSGDPSHPTAASAAQQAAPPSEASGEEIALLTNPTEGARATPQAAAPCVRERSIWRGLRVLDDTEALESFSDSLPPACQEIAEDVLERLVEITVSAKDTCRTLSEALTPRSGKASVRLSRFDADLDTATAACSALASAFDPDAAAQSVYGTFLIRVGEGLTALRREDPMPGRFETAASLLQRAAAQGDAAAMTEVGVLHLRGRGVARDYEAALALFRDAAAAGDAPAMVLIGILHQDGLGVPRDAAEAVTWFRRGAEAGEADAMKLMGWMLLEGAGTPRDADAAYGWFRRAAEAGSSDAMALLGSSYLYGRGLPQSDASALRWYGQAAEAGNASAMNWMGWFHRHGRAVPRDDSAAVAWYARAADAGNAEAMASAAWHRSRGLGAEAAPDEAGKLYVRAARFGKDLESLAAILAQEREETLQAVQAQLRAEAGYEGGATGLFDAQTRAALEAYAARPR